MVEEIPPVLVGSRSSRDDDSEESKNDDGIKDV